MKLNIYFLLSQRVPEYPGGHVQLYPVDPLTTHDPLFTHGEGEQMSTKIKVLLFDLPLEFEKNPARLCAPLTSFLCAELAKCQIMYFIQQ